MRKTSSRKLAVLDDMRQANAKYPGFLIRRMQQVASSIFFSKLREFGLTPIQHTILRVLHDNPSIDQRSLATLAGLDTSTTADILTRLADKKLISRAPGSSDRRTRLVRLSASGERLLEKVRPHILSGQQELLRPLTLRRQKALIDALLDLLAAHEVHGNEHGERRPWRRFR